MVGNCEMSRYDGAVSRAGLVPCLHCVLLLSPDVHIHTLPPRAPSSDSYPPAAINLGAAQLGGWGNPSGQKSWTQIVVIASPHRYLGWGLAPSWHSTAVVCPLLPLAPAVYRKNVNYEFFTCKLGGVPLIVNTQHYVTGCPDCPKCPRSSVHRGMSQYARSYGHCTRNIFCQQIVFSARCSFSLFVTDT